MSEIIDSPSEWVADHIRRYVDTNGDDGHFWNGVPCLLLTTVGRKSGVRRRTALIYGRDGDDYVIVASKGGHPHNPLWYENLIANPVVGLQVGADVFDAVASTYDETPARESAWKTMTGLWPAFDEYQEKAGRRIPLVRLTRR
jgi:deazaflavin-dependent oxidoreductase (nitroreductase family)